MVIDKKFIPMAKVLKEMKDGCKKYGGKPLSICVERNDGFKSTYKTEILKDEKYNEQNYKIAERIVKSLLWIYGGYKVTVGGCAYIGERLKQDYKKGGAREFDALFMAKVYGKPFNVVSADLKDVPESYEVFEKRDFSLNGCRIGFDAGGSDRKVSAVIDGKTVYSEEVLWLPKVNKDPMYHYNEILEYFENLK